MQSASLSPNDWNQLVLRSQRGEEEAFEMLYEALYPKIYRFVSFKVPPEDVEDIVADIFLKVVQNLEKYKPQPEATFSSWVYRMAHNKVVDFYRKQKAVVLDEMADEDYNLLFSSIPDYHIPEISTKTDQAFLRQQMAKALNQLSPFAKEVLELKFLEDFTNTEVAHITGKTEGNIRIIQMRALKQLRQILEGEDL